MIFHYVRFSFAATFVNLKKKTSFSDLQIIEYFDSSKKAYFVAILTIIISRLSQNWQTKLWYRLGWDIWMTLG